MAKSQTRIPVAKYLTALAVIIVGLYALVLLTGPSGLHHKLAPKLGLDLQGGTTVTLRAVRQGGKNPDKSQLDQARQIIENRVNGSGVAEAEVLIQGNNSIVINVPGHDNEDVKKIGQPAELRFRQVLGTASGAGTSTSKKSNAAPNPDQKPPAVKDVLAKFPAQAEGLIANAQQNQKPISGDDAKAFDVVKDLTPAEVAVLPPNYQMWIPQITCSELNKRLPGSINATEKEVVACGQKGSDRNNKYLLDKAEVVGTDVSGASFSYDNASGWKTSIKFTGKGQNKWTDLTKATVGKQVAVVLDNQVVSAPQIQQTIAGDAQITGSSKDPFTKNDVQTLANQLKYGSLPLSFTVDNASTVSPTLGLAQLKAGLLAGGIGLVLVVLYSLIYYRALGLVTIFSLVTSGLVIYASVVLLSRSIGFTLTLAGVAGFIVAVGITADSFVVFFERLKDEVAAGRSPRSAVPRAWVRARKTILSADAVSFMAAAVLYILAIGEVKGFAFTLGLSTIVDLLIVFLFTHPLVVLASRSRRFTSSRISGLGRMRRTTNEAGSVRRAPRQAAVKES